MGGTKDLPDNGRRRCASCGKPLSGPFCSACGEQARKPGEVSLREYLAELADALFNVEGRFLRSLRALLFQPGRLTSEYLAGRRVPWMRPLHLFLLINLAFFLLAGTTISFSTPLELHLSASNFPHRAAAEHLVYQRLEDQGLDQKAWREAIAPSRSDSAEMDAQRQAANQDFRDFELNFNRRSEIVSRTLIIALVPLATIMPWLMFFWRARSPVPHLVLATHWAGFTVLITMFAGWLMPIFRRIGTWSLDASQSELLFTTLVLGPVFVWSLAAFRRVYRLGWIVSTVSALAMILSWAALFIQLYRSFLFFAVFWSL